MTSPRVYIDSCAGCNRQISDNEVVYFVGKATARAERSWRSHHAEHRALQMDRRGHSNYEPVVYCEGCFEWVSASSKGIHNHHENVKALELTDEQIQRAWGELRGDS